ncbi:MAG: hypothetical protein HY286_18825 [Planctomycetes bacterium]|nr:hypothetical protein [Planctomycetota bacterium]
MNRNAHPAIVASIARLKRRSMLVTFIRAELRWLFYAFLALAAVGAAWFALPILGLTAGRAPFPIFIASAAAVALATAGAILQSWFERPAPVTVAKAWDDNSGGKDRLASAVQIGEGTTPMSRALIDEAVQLSKRVEPARVFPVRVPREGWWLPAPIAMTVALTLLPGWLNAGPTPNPIVTEALHNEAANIKNFVSKEKTKELTPHRKEMLERLERLAMDLSNDKARKKEALAELSKLMDDLKKDKEEQEQKKLDLEKLLKNFQNNDKNRELSEEMNQGKYDDAANRIDKLLDELKEQKKKKMEQKAPQDDLAKIDEKMKKLQDVKAQLMKMLKVNMNIKNAKEVMDFLGDLEGALGELPDEEFVDGKP